jgi:cytochrome c biogenesis protein
MRVALLLLFLLALASIPGSLFPQRGINEAKVIQYTQDNPRAAEWLDRFGLFDVFSAPWFAAIYLLLFISLVGCVLPRAVEHARAIRTPPPPAPRRLQRMPASRVLAPVGGGAGAGAGAGSAGAARAAAEQHLRRRRFRVRVGDDGSLAAEKGYARETGNLLFHLALVALLLAVAYGSTNGYRGNVLVKEGEGFANTLTQYDSFRPGRTFDATRLPPFSFTLRDFTVEFEREGTQRGAPREFFADVAYRTSPDAEMRQARVQVNSPLVVDGAKLFLVGWGYAPRFTVRDGEGRVVLRDSVAFLPQDGNFASTGVIKSPDARPEQLGIQGIFLPTTLLDGERGPISIFPAALNPSVFMSAWTGDLGLDEGRPQSVYQLDTTNMERIGIKALGPGESWDLPNGAGRVTFEGVEQFATFQVASDPGSGAALVAAVVAMVGLVLSLFVRRRRLWVRASDGDDGDEGAPRTVVHVAGLARTENGDPGADLDDLVEALGGAGFEVVEPQAATTSDAASEVPT